MSTKHTQKHTKAQETKKPQSTHDTGHAGAQKNRMREKDEAVRHADETALNDRAEQDWKTSSDRTAGQYRAFDQKRNNEQQYHAGGVAHDPHNRTQERVDRGDADAGDIEEETRSENAPYNKTYGHHQ
jgi:hypothetical protein